MVFCCLPGTVFREARSAAVFSILRIVFGSILHIWILFVKRKSCYNFQNFPRGLNDDQILMPGFKPKLVIYLGAASARLPLYHSVQPARCIPAYKTYLITGYFFKVLVHIRITIYIYQCKYNYNSIYKNNKTI